MTKEKDKIIFNEPKQERSQYLVDIILESTLVELMRNGIEKLTTTQVSKRAGVSIGSIYQYFPNKETLLVELAKKITKRNRVKLENLIKTIDEPTVDDEIKIITDFLVDRFVADSKYIKYLYKFVVYFDQYEFIFSSRYEVVQMLSNYLVRRKKMPEERALKVAYVLTNSFVGVLHSYALESKAKLTVEELRYELFMLFSLRLKQDTLTCL